MQRRLLPTLPALGGLDVASSYVAGADRQQVGGDWFDVFELPSGQIAVAIGDVMGHDVDAAATMAQVRAALRSYALAGGEPADTVDQLARFVELFGVSAVVTVVYGVLQPARLGTDHATSAGRTPAIFPHYCGTRTEGSRSWPCPAPRSWGRPPPGRDPQERSGLTSTPPCCSTPTAWWRWRARTSA